MPKGSNYTDKLRRMYDTVDQSDSGMMRSDETKARLKNIRDSIKQSESAGAGRGGQGGPTAKELKGYEQSQDAGVWTANKGVPAPQDIDGASVTPKPKKMASGGSASSRADGCASRGKTRGKFV